MLFGDKPANDSDLIASNLVDEFALSNVPCLNVRLWEYIQQCVHNRLSQQGFSADWSASHVRSNSWRHDEYGGDLDGLRRYNHQRRPVYRAVLDRHLHINCCQRRRSHQICLCRCYGIATQSNHDFCFAHHSQSPERGAAAICCLPINDEQHSCNLVSIGWQNHHERTIHRSDCGRNLHRDSSQRCRHDQDCFGHRQRVATPDNRGEHFSQSSRYAREMATAVRGDGFRFQQYRCNLGSHTRNWNDHTVRSLHGPASRRSRHCQSYKSGRQH